MFLNEVSMRLLFCDTLLSMSISSCQIHKAFSVEGYCFLDNHVLYELLKTYTTGDGRPPF